MSVKAHNPVMLVEMLAALAPVANKIYVDGTFGAGGYSKAILGKADCQVIGIDRDESVAPFAEVCNTNFPGRFKLITGTFSNMQELLAEKDIRTVDGVVLDIGVSSMQLDRPERGFSFQADGPLDMRMGDDAGISAYDVVNSYKEEELADIIYQFGDERKSRAIAKRIVIERGKAPITSTLQLADLVAAVVHVKPGSIHPATRTFQALRIYVNRELDELKQGLEAARHILRAEGRLVVVTFHSLEDGIVKRFLQTHTSKRVARSKYAKEQPEEGEFRLLNKKPITPSAAEIKANIRSRSAKLRAAIKL